jgi:hypothetical protein
VVGVIDTDPLVIGYLSRYNHYVAVVAVDAQASGTTDYDFDDGSSRDDAEAEDGSRGWTRQGVRE